MQLEPPCLQLLLDGPFLHVAVAAKQLIGAKAGKGHHHSLCSRRLRHQMAVEAINAGLINGL